MKNSSKIVFEQERDFSDKINITFNFVTANFKPLCLSLLYLTGPLVLIGGIFSGLVQIAALEVGGLAQGQSPEGTNPAEIFGEIIGKNTAYLLSANYFFALLFIFLATIMVAATVYAFFIEYQESEDPTNITVTMVWERVKGLFLPILASILSVTIALLVIVLAFVLFISIISSGAGSGVGANLSIFLTGMLCFITILYLGIIFILNTPIVAFERIGTWEAFSRANYLIQQKWWSTFGLMIIFAIINYFLSLVFSAPSIIITFLKIFKVGAGGTGNIPIIISTIFATIGRVLISSLTYVALSFQYFNLVERRDGNSLKSQISDIGQKKTFENEDEEY